MPPMTVVPWSFTSTVVWTRCVLIETLPLACTVPRDPLSTSTSRMTVPDAEMRGSDLQRERRGLELHLRHRLDDGDAVAALRHRRQRGVGDFLTARDGRLDVVLRDDARA